MFRYLADAAGFEECLTGRVYLVAMEGDLVALERAYMASEAGGTGTAIMASFDGEIARRPAMEGDRATPTVVVRRCGRGGGVFEDGFSVNLDPINVRYRRW